jgi:hypothetical protein
MGSAHIIEVGDRTAGIVIREHGGFRFFASESVFRPLEAAVFRTTGQAARAAHERIRLRKVPGRGPLTLPDAV